MSLFLPCLLFYFRFEVFTVVVLLMLVHFNFLFLLYFIADGDVVVVVAAAAAAVVCFCCWRFFSSSFFLFFLSCLHASSGETAWVIVVFPLLLLLSAVVVICFCCCCCCYCCFCCCCNCCCCYCCLCCCRVCWWCLVPPSDRCVMCAVWFHPLACVWCVVSGSTSWLICDVYLFHRCLDWCVMCGLLLHPMTGVLSVWSSPMCDMFCCLASISRLVFFLFLFFFWFHRLNDMWRVLFVFYLLTDVFVFCFHPLYCVVSVLSDSTRWPVCSVFCCLTSTSFLLFYWCAVCVLFGSLQRPRRGVCCLLLSFDWTGVLSMVSRVWFVSVLSDFTPWLDWCVVYVV